jgi:hypothetical protein
MVRNIRRVDQELVLQTNAGTLVTDMRAEVPQYGAVWYHPYTITNIFSFAEMGINIQSDTIQKENMHLL